MNAPNLIEPVWPGLVAPREASTPAHRRAWLRGLTNTQLGNAIAEMALRGREPLAKTADDWAQLVGVPPGELLASPFGARACLMGSAAGVTATHWEARSQAGPPLPPDAHSGHSIPSPEFNIGVLAEGKYESFCQDEPLIGFNPNHSARWTAHEMMHRAVGHFWHPTASAWHWTLAARLGELLPVVLWYGPDNVARLDDPARWFDRYQDAQQPDAPQAAAKWLVESQQSLLRRVEDGLFHFIHGLDRFELELAAVREEALSGRPVTLRLGPYHTLDSQSDAMTYAEAHANRLQSSGLSWLHRRVLRAGRDYAASIESFDQRVERAFDDLIFGSLPLPAPHSLVKWRARAAGRLVWDVLHRRARRGAYTSRAFTAERCGAALDAAFERDDPCPALALLDQLQSATQPRGARWQGSLSSLSAPNFDWTQIEAGVASLAPLAWSFVRGRAKKNETLQKLALHPCFASRRPLGQRLLSANPWPHPALHALATLEVAVATLPTADATPPFVAQVTPPLARSKSRVWTNPDFFLVQTDWDVLAMWESLGGPHGNAAETPVPPTEQPTALLIGRWAGRLTIIPVNPSITDAWLALSARSSAHWPSPDLNFATELAGTGAVLWVVLR